MTWLCELEHVSDHDMSNKKQTTFLASLTELDELMFTDIVREEKI
jgi:hypothetical protein